MQEGFCSRASIRRACSYTSDDEQETVEADLAVKFANVVVIRINWAGYFLWRILPDNLFSIGSSLLSRAAPATKYCFKGSHSPSS
jgi:hypothetical protein